MFNCAFEVRQCFLFMYVQVSEYLYLVYMYLYLYIYLYQYIVNRYTHIYYFFSPKTHARPKNPALQRNSLFISRSLDRALCPLYLSLSPYLSLFLSLSCFISLDP